MFLEIELDFFGAFFHDLQNLSLEGIRLATIVSKGECRSLEYGSVGSMRTFTASAVTLTANHR